MGKPLILSLDVGTSGIKCALFTTSGELLDSVTVPYKTYYPFKGWAEQNSDDFWDGAVKGVRELTAKSDEEYDIQAIGLSGHMNGLLPLDAEGKPLYNDIIHLDIRTASICHRLKKSLGERAYYNITGNRIDPHYSMAKIMWLKEHMPEIDKKTRYYTGSKDYLSGKLTGKWGQTDFSDAGLTGLIDINNAVWADGLIKELGIDKNKLSQIKPATHLAGTLTSEAAKALGLKSGIPVSIGGGDGSCATAGAGVTAEGKAYNCLGSSSWISVLKDKPMLDDEMRCFNYHDLTGELINIAGTVQSAATSFDWVADNIAGDGSRDFDSIAKMAGAIKPGAEGLLFFPCLLGERTPYWDDSLRGAYIGITPSHGKAHLLRSAYEGIAYALKSVIEVFNDNGTYLDELVMLGGGANSSLWIDILSSVFDAKLKVHDNPSMATAMGAAMAAGVGIGIYKDMSEAADVFVKTTSDVLPNEAMKEQYKKYYPVYKMIYPCLKPIYKKMQNIED